jgi:hypothetical protein
MTWDEANAIPDEQIDELIVTIDNIAGNVDPTSRISLPLGNDRAMAEMRTAIRAALVEWTSQ